MEGVSESEEQKELKSLISDWGISHSTLEEVFMRVTDKKHQQLTE
jgi:hypothetical protein